MAYDAPPEGHSPLITMRQVPELAPVWQAWDRYKATPEFANTFSWAAQPGHTLGALWASFHEGFVCAAVEVSGGLGAQVLDEISAAHDARVTELLHANNAEVERRRAAERALAQRRRSTLCYVDGEATPDVRPGGLMLFLAVITRGASPAAYTVPAYYLNAYPLLMNGGEGCGACPDDGSHDDGCPQTGWHDCKENDEYDDFYTPLLRLGDKLLCWAEIPQPEQHGVIHQEATP